jgi:hypothetical protein
LSRPGVASVLTPSFGIIHECRTSVAVTIIRMNEFIGLRSWRGGPGWPTLYGPILALQIR